MGKTSKNLHEIETYLACNDFLGAATIVELNLEKQPTSIDLAMTHAYTLFHAQKYSKAWMGADVHYHIVSSTPSSPSPTTTRHCRYMKS